MAKISLGTTGGKFIFCLVTHYRLKVDKHTQEQSIVFGGVFECPDLNSKTDSLVMPPKMAEKVRKSFDKNGYVIFSFDENGFIDDVKPFDLFAAFSKG